MRQKKSKKAADGSSVSGSHQLGARSKRSMEASSKTSAKVVPDLDHADESLVPSSPQSPEAFLDAVVSAAPATGAPSESSYNFAQPCFGPSPSSSYPYPTIANDLSLQPPDSFSNTTVPDLDYASNDDILRALQDLDVTKIASVLKTLGEAAAAANVPLATLPSTLLQRQQPATPIDSTPPDSTPMNEGPAPQAPQHHRTLVDVNTQRGSLEHSDHAGLLATKWLSANKLAELARTQGQCCGTSPFVSYSMPSIRDRIGV